MFTTIKRVTNGNIRVVKVQSDNGRWAQYIEKWNGPIGPNVQEVILSNGAKYFLPWEFFPETVEHLKDITEFYMYTPQDLRDWKVVYEFLTEEL